MRALNLFTYRMHACLKMIVDCYYSRRLLETKEKLPRPGKELFSNYALRNIENRLKTSKRLSPIKVYPWSLAQEWNTLRLRAKSVTINYFVTGKWFVWQRKTTLKVNSLHYLTSSASFSCRFCRFFRPSLSSSLHITLLLISSVNSRCVSAIFKSGRLLKAW